MGTNSAATNAFARFTANPHVAGFWENASTPERIGVIVIVALMAHIVVKTIRYASEWSIQKSHEQKRPFEFVTRQPKFITVTRLVVSTVTFLIYALAILFVLMASFQNATENIVRTYLTSAAVIGLALSFGLQGLVQDVVTGITLILSDAMDVGDIVDLSGTIGRVEQIGLRFTRLVNFYNQVIFIPNRNILNVARFPHRGVHAYADVQIPAKADAEKISKLVADTAKGMWMEFGGVILDEPALGEVVTLPGNGCSFLRVQFKIWPGQGALIETTFRQQIVNAMKAFEPDYTDWMVPVTYRVLKSS
ncbi:MAG TPA: mechanosensitive ion channel domain-containing protein [Verrucomicrobiae bacterium]|nr:mechanosensitive ion channel domain-containing protein [Verrucomicrobiae bacterium]